MVVLLPLNQFPGRGNQNPTVTHVALRPSLTPSKTRLPSSPPVAAMVPSCSSNTTLTKTSPSASTHGAKSTKDHASRAPSHTAGNTSKVGMKMTNEMNEIECKNE